MPIAYEIEVLRHLNGEDTPDLIWGAAMSEALSALKSGGFVKMELASQGTMAYVITDKGREALSIAKSEG